MFDDYAPAIRFNFRFNECNELFFVRNENDFGNEKGKPQNGNTQNASHLLPGAMSWLKCRIFIIPNT